MRTRSRSAPRSPIGRTVGRDVPLSALGGAEGWAEVGAAPGAEQQPHRPHPPTPSAWAPPSPPASGRRGAKARDYMRAKRGLRLAGRLLYRDGLILVIDKPAGIAVHPGPGGGPNLESSFDELRFGLPHPPALAHRLDRDTGGCLVLGRHPKALRRLGA